MIWSDFEGIPSLFLIDGDLRRFEGIVVNWTEDYPLVQDMLQTMYDETTGYLRTDGLLSPERMSGIHLGETKLQFNYIVRCGFAP